GVAGAPRTERSESPQREDLRLRCVAGCSADADIVEDFLKFALRQQRLTERRNDLRRVVAQFERLAQLLFRRSEVAGVDVAQSQKIARLRVVGGSLDHVLEMD